MNTRLDREGIKLLGDSVSLNECGPFSDWSRYDLLQMQVIYYKFTISIDINNIEGEALCRQIYIINHHYWLYIEGKNEYKTHSFRSFIDLPELF